MQPTLPDTVREVQRGIHGIKIGNQEEGTNINQVDLASWMMELAKVNHIRNLKELVYSNCRLLYGAERYRFYDATVCASHDQDDTQFCVTLTCNFNTETKVLRKEYGTDSVTALVALLTKLQRDSGLVAAKYSVGAVLEGQQGWLNEVTGVWELDDTKKDNPPTGQPVDLIPDLEERKANGKRRGDYYTPRHGRQLKRSMRGPPERVEESPKVDEYY